MISPEEVKYFATFGSGQLEFTDLYPLAVMAVLPGGTEEELRQALREPPFNNEYCMTYPIDRAERMRTKFGMSTLTIDEIKDAECI